MARLDIERQERLEPSRIEYAVKRIKELGYEIIYRDNLMIKFIHKGQPISFYPYSGWASGKTVRDGRGLSKLLNQLK